MDSRDAARRGALEAYSWPIPSLSAPSFASLTTSGPGWYLVGDAAGLVDPITREGIYFALASGEWAADAIAAAGTGAERQYHERVRDEIGSELVRAARYKAGFFSPGSRGCWSMRWRKAPACARSWPDSSPVRSLMRR